MNSSDMKRHYFLQVFTLFYIQVILWKIGFTSHIPIEPPSIITAYNTSSSSINVRWGWNATDYQSKHNLSGYKLTYRGPNKTNEVFHLLCTLNSSAELTKLKVFTNYCIEIASFTNNSVSNRSQCLLVTTDEEPPNAPPQNFTAFSISSTSIRVTWDPLPVENRRGIILGYRLFFRKMSDSRRKRRSFGGTEGTEVIAYGLSKDLVRLEKFTNYCVCAEAFNSKGSSNETNHICIRTDEDVPSHPPLNISAHNTSSTSVSVGWDVIPTEFIHGILLGYKVFYGKTSEPPSQYIFKTLKTDQSGVKLANLEKFTEYCVQLAGFTRIGDGNKSECFNVTTDEDVPSGAPQPVVQSFYSKTAIMITWDLLPASVSHGTVLGYKIHVKEIGSDTDLPEDVFKKWVLIENASQTSFRFGNLSLTTKYQVQMAAYTSKGVGPLSDVVYAETCRCPKLLSTFKRPSSLDKGGPGGISDVIGNVIIESCGDCAEHGKTELVFTSVDDGESNVRFPVEVTSPRGSDFSKFVAVLEVPGVVVIRRRDESTHRFYEEIMTGSILDAWPVIAVSLLMIYFAGVVVWFLDRKGNPGDLPRNFIAGAYEGFWWSFITMTTVGYGDRCPKSFSARAFAIIWLLVSMVLFTFFMGTISSILTVTVMRSRTTVVPSGGNKAAAITDSSEAKLALGSLSSKLKLTETYPTVERLAQSLKEGEVDYILVDMYLPVKRRDLFNGSWFEIAALFETEVFHGVILQGDALKLASTLEEMIANSNVQTKFLTDTEEGPTEVESNESLFFDPSSPFFQQILYASLGVLGLFLVCGVLYQVLYFKRRMHLERVNVTEREKTRRELESLVEEFCRSLQQIYEMLRKKHRKELLELARQKRKGRSTRNAERANIPMETFNSNNQLLHIRSISSGLN